MAGSGVVILCIQRKTHLVFSNNTYLTDVTKRRASCAAAPAQSLNTKDVKTGFFREPVTVYDVTARL